MHSTPHKQGMVSLWCENSNESSSAVLSCRDVCCVAHDGSNYESGVKILKYFDHSREGLGAVLSIGSAHYTVQGGF